MNQQKQIFVDTSTNNENLIFKAVGKMNDKTSYLKLLP